MKEMLTLIVFKILLFAYRVVLAPAQRGTGSKRVKGSLLRCSLSLYDCQGQTFNRASNMMDKHTGISTKISAEQPKAIATHCQGHSLSLAKKYLTKDCEILRDTMGTVGDICVLVSYSPNEKKILGKITDTFEGIFDEEITN